MFDWCEDDLVMNGESLRLIKFLLDCLINNESPRLPASITLIMPDKLSSLFRGRYEKNTLSVWSAANNQLMVFNKDRFALILRRFPDDGVKIGDVFSGKCLMPSIEIERENGGSH